MRKSVFLLGSALVALLVVGMTGLQVATAPDNRTYVWHAEVVSVDSAGKTMTVKTLVRDPVLGYIGQIKPGEKIVLVWDLLNTIESDTVLYLAKYDVMKASKVDVGYILPVEFVSADTAGKSITVKVAASDALLQRVKPGQWAKVTTPMNQPTDVAVLGSMDGGAGRPQLAQRPIPVPQVAKVNTPEEYDKAMKAIGAAFGAVNKAVASGSTTDAKTQLATAKATMGAVQTFWVEKKKDDPAMIAKDSVAKMDVLEKALAGTDTAAVAAAVKDVGGTCGACHAKYREQDPTTKQFSIKAGTL
jgi:cytochrome c556